MTVHFNVFFASTQHTIYGSCIFFHVSLSSS